jgi:hypothetical protein
LTGVLALLQLLWLLLCSIQCLQVVLLLALQFGHHCCSRACQAACFQHVHLFWHYHKCKLAHLLCLQVGP